MNGSQGVRFPGGGEATSDPEMVPARKSSTPLLARVRESLDERA